MEYAKKNLAHSVLKFQRKVPFIGSKREISFIIQLMKNILSCSYRLTCAVTMALLTDKAHSCSSTA